MAEPEVTELRPRGFGYAEDAATGVATITLARPERLNALTFEIYRELRDLLRALQERSAVRAVLVTGTGRAFCSGGDVHEIIGPLLQCDARGLLDFTRLTCDLIRAMRALRRPIVAGLNGTAAGAGAVIALAADLRIASDRAKIAFLFSKVGLAGADMGAAWLLPRVVGLSRATELLLLGDSVDAAAAERCGLFNRVVPHDDLPREARALAERLARGPTFAYGMTKEMLNREAGLDLDAALEAEAQAQLVCMQTDDFREAYRAFVAKREPRFCGQ